VELFDLKNDPDEMHNLALDGETILPVNALLNDLMASEGRR
jgi:hypothetical protein